jgi:hypothetical protein
MMPIEFVLWSEPHVLVAGSRHGGTVCAGDRLFLTDLTGRRHPVVAVDTNLVRRAHPSVGRAARAPLLTVSLNGPVAEQILYVGQVLRGSETGPDVRRRELRRVAARAAQMHLPWFPPSPR